MTLSGTTRILGIFGDPVAHTLSPLMQNAALRQTGIDAVYVPFHVKAEELGDAVRALRVLNIWGVNVTVPHKEAVCEWLDEVDAEARLIGAVNTIANRNGRLVGFNTDATGFLRSLRQDLNFDPCSKKILLLGAGGACRAALVALGQEGARHIHVANRTPERAEALVQEFAAVFQKTRLDYSGLDSDALRVAAKDLDLVVNSSAVGLKGEAFTALPWQSFGPEVAVYDMVYALQGTPLVRAALEKGLRAVGGQGMLVCQGEEAFSIWTGRKSPDGVMKTALDEKMNVS
ncbi:MAG: shikimate dehydrogenase [Syntrophotaleaceae bacterium]